MIKSLLLTVSPTEALNVLNGKQTALLRKRVPKGYVGWCYGVVSKGKPYLIKAWGKYYLHNKDAIKGILQSNNDKRDYLLNGKIPFRFWYEEVSTLEYHKRNEVLMWDDNYYYYTKDSVYNNVECILDELQLEHQEVLDYGNGKDLYAITINKLEIFDKPMELEQFRNIGTSTFQGKKLNHVWKEVTKSPSAYQYVWVKE